MPWGCTPARGHRQTPGPSCSPVPAVSPGVPKLPRSLPPRAHAGTPAAAPQAPSMSQQPKLKKKSWEAEHSPLKSSWWFIQLLIAVSLITRRVMEVCVRPGSVAGSHRLTPAPLRSGDVSAQERSSKDEEPAPRAQPAALGAGDPGSRRAGGGGRAPGPVLPISCTLPQAPWDFFHGTGTAWYSPCKQLCTDTVRRGGVNWAPLQCAEES